MIGAFLSTDHKVVAIRAGVVAAIFFAGAGVLALLMRAELARPGLQVVSRAGYTQLFTMHGSTMIFLVVIPVALAFCLYLVPLQVGSQQVSGARWAFAGQWLFALGGIVMWTGWLTREGAGRAGWYAYDPLARTPATPGPGMDLWLCGAIMATLGAILVAGAVLTTIVRRRAPGMTMLRLPVFTWTALASCLLVVFAFPSLVVAFGLLLAERHGARILDPIAYQHLFWFYGHPAVYVMFFPFVGMVAETASVLSDRRFFGYRAFVLALLAFTALSMSAWAHHMFTTGAVPSRLFALTSTALILPAGIEYFDTIATLWRGAVRFNTAMLFVFGFLLQFLVGGMSGIFVASPVLDYHAQDSYIVVAHFHYTLFAGSMFGLFAGLYLYWPKLTGRYLSERLGRVHFALLVVGTNLTFLPMFFLGEQGMARRLADYPDRAGWGALNLASSVGAGFIALGTLLFCVSVALSFLRARSAPADAWGTGMSLEWATSSPPPPHNFDALPPVRSYAPLYDLRHPGGAPTAPPAHPAGPRPQGASA
ncbi:MAG: cytochrome c oxidase subunit [Solirubrobacteraceae bacterium]|jgi:cytochrome c oxidase subunit 1|nr:cytochrome c oxidase subunit [Solirubrobacteraceae bacterium]